MIWRRFFGWGFRFWFRRTNEANFGGRERGGLFFKLLEFAEGLVERALEADFVAREVDEGGAAAVVAVDGVGQAFGVTDSEVLNTYVRVKPKSA